uniref:carbohydrate binding domain-containing protein n=1 Tax=Acetatifactor sp. TaxID=1872090 RepID=UPI004056B2FC
MKSKIIKRNVAIGAASLATLITAGAILNSALSVKAEETLFGIETLIQEVQSRQTPYRILEIVPDEKASEIGYYIPGYEPVLSAREAGTGVWSDWAEGLKQYRTEEERSAYMEELNQSLQTFYSLRGFSGNNIPVSYEGYQESEEPGDGYRELVFDSEVRKGFFAYYSGMTQERYHLDFYYAGNYEDDEFTGELTTQYYYIEDAAQITVGMLDALPDDTVLYRFVSQMGAERFEKAGTWAELKDAYGEEEEELPEEQPDMDVFTTSVSGNGRTVSGNDPSGDGSVSDGDVDPNEPTEFFTIRMAAWQQGMTPAYLALYAVENMVLAEDGEFEFRETENGYDTTFQLDTVYFTGGFTNRLWFHTNVLNMLPENASLFPIEVVTLTAAELGAMGEIPAFDLLYLNSGKQTVATDTVIMPYSATNDIGDAMRLNLFRNVVSEGKPCIVDSAILYNTGSDGTINFDRNVSGTGIFKLAAMMELTSPHQYYTEIILTGAAEPENLLEYLIANTVVDADKNFVVEQTYSFYEPMSLIGPGFVEKNIFVNGVAQENTRAQGFTAVLDEIISENLNREADISGAYAPLPTDVSQATAVRHILNYKNRRQIDVKEHLRVLEIQPAKSDDDSYDLTEEEIKEWAPGVRTVEIDRMTTAEFIGKIEDINENYDLIYIGTDKDTMNTVTGVEPFMGVKNGNFERGTTGWSVWGNTAFIIAGGANGTEAALQTTNTTLTQVFAVEPGETYTLSACAKSAGGRCTVGVDFMWGPTD